MLVEVYGNGDIFVSYAGNEKWFPFAMEEPHASSFLPSFSVAYASSSAADGKTEMIKPNTIKIDSYKRQPVIDIGKIIQIQKRFMQSRAMRSNLTIYV